MPSTRVTMGPPVSFWSVLPRHTECVCVSFKLNIYYFLMLTAPPSTLACSPEIAWRVWRLENTTVGRNSKVGSLVLYLEAGEDRRAPGGRPGP